MSARIHPSKRVTIAKNISACRIEKFPEHGGSRKCAAEFSRYIGKHITPQQWSVWECGMRTPKEESLQQIAEFFGKTLEYMYSDNSPPASPIPVMPRDVPAGSSYADMSAPELIMAMGQSRMKVVYEVEISVVSMKFVPHHKRAEQ